MPSPSRLVRCVARALANQARSYSHGGLLIAIGFFCLAQTPSLVPRHGVYQALLTGIASAIGYAVGIASAWIYRTLGFTVTWKPHTRRVFGIVVAAIALLSIPTFLYLGERWQAQIRALVGIDTAPPARVFQVLFIALAIFVVLVQMGRGLRWLGVRVAHWLGRFLPVPVSRTIATVLVATLTVLTFNGAVVDGTLRILKSIYGQVDTTTDAGVARPTSQLRSGGPGSLVNWDDLGRQGRNFVAGGASTAQLGQFAAATEALQDTTAIEPIRVYAGLRSAGTLAEEAQLVVDELDRTKAWERDVLVVATATGTGWIDPSFLTALEYQHAGNTAVATMQYSFLPSWVGFLSDRATPPAAGTALFDAVYAKWSTLPKATRPYLLVYGLSLGSYGAQGAFSGTQDLAARSDGAVFAGTPNFTSLWSTETANRDRGSLEYHPIVDDGAQVRWLTSLTPADSLWRLQDEWGPQRTVYLQHASDPVVWWSPALAWNKPDWLSEPAGPDRSETMRWIPLVTFWQVSFDLFVAGDVPQGHGHNYHLEYARALEAVGAPSGWSQSDTDRLIALMTPMVSQA
ncbi:alpha/beta hydrolase [Rarobacter incanus]|uniref:Putative membrane protein n=1 Tax=Rarobacter incanus TaxID=153494 RepID=A0A542SMF3_9MICO|nr:alpha/beta-hydrolase family protein [Rarobacter incanus]TQK75655.1 putative membrane protein [Rarobacter incanus]